MAKYIYPAIFTEEDHGAYSVRFPDVDGALTCGDNLQDALFMASDALSLMMVGTEDEHQPIPAPSDIKSIHTNPNEFCTLISCDTDRYRRLLRNKAVRKTLSVPEWLNDAALAEGLNFSQVLQEALKEKLGIND